MQWACVLGGELDGLLGLVTRRAVSLLLAQCIHTSHPHLHLRGWLQYSEVVHSRWAMLGAVGCLAPEYLAAKRVIPAETGVLWFRSGWLPPAGSDFDFASSGGFGGGFGPHLDATQLFALMLPLMAAAKLLRLRDFLRPARVSLRRPPAPVPAIGSGTMALPSMAALEALFTSEATGDPAYPGGRLFNPLELVRDTSASLGDFKEVELAGGRVAMVAMVAFAAQAAATGKGPYRNLLDYMADPLLLHAGRFD